MRWLQEPYNLDGWRIDVGNMTGRLGADDLNHEVARMLRARLEEVKPGAMLLAESTSDAAPDVPGDGWQGAVSYTNFTRPLWQFLAKEPDPEAIGWFFGLPQDGPARIDAADFVATHREFSAGYSWEVRLANANALDTHDTARAASHMIEGGQLIAACAQFSFPGIPLVFAGDEFGLEGFNGEDSRTPMPWDAPEKWGADLRGLYAELAALRTEHRALVDGSLRFIHAARRPVGLCARTRERIRAVRDQPRARAGNPARDRNPAGAGPCGAAPAGGYGPATERERGGRTAGWCARCGCRLPPGAGTRALELGPAGGIADPDQAAFRCRAQWPSPV